MMRKGEATVGNPQTARVLARLATCLVGCLVIVGCTNSTAVGVSALVPPAALAEETRTAEDGSAGKASGERGPKLADAPDVETAEAAASKSTAAKNAGASPPAATAFAEAQPDTRRPSADVAGAAQSGADKSKAAKPTGLFAAFLQSNSAAKTQAARNRRDAERRLAKLKKQRASRARNASASSGSALPGVRTERVFGIEVDAVPRASRTAKKRPAVVMASVAAAARGSGRNLARQHGGVSVGCLKPALVKRIRMAERHFGRRAVVTSGYRSPRHNRRVRGARRSMHMSCAAADVQMSGITKWQLAKYFRTQSGRGGVGTYCHTRSVHVDIGEKRDWNWRCRRKKRRS